MAVAITASQFTLDPSGGIQAVHFTSITLWWVMYRAPLSLNFLWPSDHAPRWENHSFILTSWLHLKIQSLKGKSWNIFYCYQSLLLTFIIKETHWCVDKKVTTSDLVTILIQIHIHWEVFLHLGTSSTRFFSITCQLTWGHIWPENSNPVESGGFPTVSTDPNSGSSLTICPQETEAISLKRLTAKCFWKDSLLHVRCYCSKTEMLY